MKVVFLDCDGVISPMSGPLFSPEHMRRLKRIVDATEAKIVLSSSWRVTSFGRNEVMNRLAEHGIAGFVDCTPSIPNRTRAHEILKWVHDNKKRYEVDNFLALDDINLAATAPDKKFFERHAICTDSLKGLTDQDVEKAINMLTESYTL